jgi:hypothetical protein
MWCGASRMQRGSIRLSFLSVSSLALISPQARTLTYWNLLVSWTSTVTSIVMKASVLLTKLPEAGTTCAISRLTATGMGFALPKLRFVGSNAIQPAPGTKTSAHVWVEPLFADPASVRSGLKMEPETIRAPEPKLRAASANRTAKSLHARAASAFEGRQWRLRTLFSLVSPTSNLSRLAIPTRRSRRCTTWISFAR